MKYSNKQELTTTLGNFLNQRKYYFRERNLPDMEAVRGRIEGRFQLIRDNNYWRHCLEVANAELLILAILPSASGGQKEERQHLLEMIEHCKAVAAIPAREYNQQHHHQIKQTNY